MAASKVSSCACTILNPTNGGSIGPTAKLPSWTLPRSASSRTDAASLSLRTPSTARPSWFAMSGLSWPPTRPTSSSPSPTMAARPGKSTGSPTKRASRMRTNEFPQRTQLHDARIASNLKEQEMKGMAWLALAVSFFVACAPSEAQQTKPSAKQQPPTVASVMAVQMKVVEDQFVPVAEAMPEDKYSFVPTTGEFAGTRTFALQVKHVATANFVFFSAILGQKP